MNVYITDGSEECFYAAAFRACTDNGCLVTSAKTFQPPLGARMLEVAAEADKAERVRAKLRALDGRALRDISLILRRGCDTREMTALNYLRLIVAEGGPVRGQMAHPAVIEALSERKKVTLEAHRFTGFLRFMEGENGVYYAPFAPDNDILELILPHFLRRFASQPFVIHDTARRKAALYNTKDCIVTQTEEKVSVALSSYEAAFQALWKDYYAAVTVAQRPNERQMKGYMPVRYWKFMPEKQEP